MNLIKITAMWCPSCIIMNKIYKEIKTEMNLNMIELDYDFDDIREYNVGQVLPVLIVTNDNNQELLRLVGELSKNEIISKLESIIRK